MLSSTQRKKTRPLNLKAPSLSYLDAGTKVSSLSVLTDAESTATANNSRGKPLDQATLSERPQEAMHGDSYNKDAKAHSRSRKESIVHHCDSCWVLDPLLIQSTLSTLAFCISHHSS
jgi:hypothetical protein